MIDTGKQLNFGISDTSSRCVLDHALQLRDNHVGHHTHIERLEFGHRSERKRRS